MSKTIPQLPDLGAPPWPTALYMPVSRSGVTKKVELHGLANMLYFNAQKWGAKGDGTTDDTQKLNDLVQAANAVGGATVYIPKGAGAYMVTTVSLESNITVMFEPGAMIKAKASVDYHGLMGAYGKENIQIYNAIFDGNRGNATVYCLGFNTCSNITVDGCTFQNSLGFALQATTSIVGFRLTNCRFYRTGYTNTPGVADCTSVSFEEAVSGNSRNVICAGNVFEDVGLGCVQFQNYNDVLFTGNYGKKNSACLIYTNPGSCKRFRIIGNYSETEGLGAPLSAGGFDLLNLSESIVKGNIASGNGAFGIGIFACQNVLVEGNRCDNNHQDSANGYTAGIWIRNNDSTTKNITVTGNSCTDTHSVTGDKTQFYGLVYDPGIEGLIIDATNNFAGNKTDEIGIANGTDLTVVSSRRLYRTEVVRVVQSTWDIPSTAAGVAVIHDIAAPGIIVSDVPIVQPGQRNGIVTAECLTDTIRLVYFNTLPTTQDPTSYTFSVIVFKTIL